MGLIPAFNSHALEALSMSTQLRTYRPYIVTSLLLPVIGAGIQSFFEWWSGYKPERGILWEVLNPALWVIFCVQAGITFLASWAFRKRPLCRLLVLVGLLVRWTYLAFLSQSGKTRKHESQDGQSAASLTSRQVAPQSNLLHKSRSLKKEEDSDGANRIDPLGIPSPSYRKEVLGLLVAEANAVARQLQLQGEAPIAPADVINAYVPAPQLADRLGGAIGNITTKNYVYCMSVGNKFSFLVRTDLQREYAVLRKQYLWPCDRMDTNAALALAKEFLVAASMDVTGLSRDCSEHVVAFTPEGASGKHFVPLYWAYWVPTKAPRSGSIASVELLLPTRMLRQMHVNESKYILRTALRATNSVNACAVQASNTY
jgi:hypothetical protein